MKLTGKELLVFFAVAFVFALVQAKGLASISPGDENTYFYMAKEISEGQLPYRDFFYAHPPLHILILSIIVGIFGINFVALKSATLIAILASSFFVYKISLEIFKNRFKDQNYLAASLISLLLYLFSFDILFKGTFSIGIEFSLMFLQISFYLFLTHRHFLGGIFAGLAGLTRFYTIPVIFALLVFMAIKKIQERKIKDVMHFLLGFSLTFIFVIGALVLIFGDKFTEPVFTYHLLKTKLPGQRNMVYKIVLQNNWTLLLAFTSSLFIKNKKTPFNGSVYWLSSTHLSSA